MAHDFLFYFSSSLSFKEKEAELWNKERRETLYIGLIAPLVRPLPPYVSTTKIAPGATQQSTAIETRRKKEEKKKQVCQSSYKQQDKRLKQVLW